MKEEKKKKSMVFLGGLLVGMAISPFYSARLDVVVVGILRIILGLFGSVIIGLYCYKWGVLHEKDKRRTV